MSLIQPIPQVGYVYEDKEFGGRILVVTGILAMEPTGDSTLCTPYISYEILEGGLRASRMHRAATSYVMSEQEFMRWGIVEGNIPENPNEVEEEPLRVFVRAENAQELQRILAGSK